MENIILQTDSYKVSHAEQYPPGTEQVYSYFESRGGKFNYVVFFGLQYYLKKYLEGPVVSIQGIDEAEHLLNQHFAGAIKFDRSKWEYIVDKYQGRLPVKIKAVPEGTVVPVRNVLMTIENTDPKCFWLTNYLETLLSQIWYPCTVATNSMEIRNLIHSFTEPTSENTNVDFKLHDFGYRGVSSQETSAIGSASHLLSFRGTDTLSSIKFIMEYYNTDKMPGFSVPASEHSTITSWGREREVDAYKNMLEKYPTGPMACVSDSYNIYEACWKLWGTELKDMVLERDGVLIIRPDSGNPPDVVLKVLNILGEFFGYTENELGFKVLNPKVRVIQGDGVNYEMIREIYEAITRDYGSANFMGKWAAENIGFGSGGALLQKMDRDTQKFAFKCS